jgi:polyisoprenyl-teichoic acid--peptidoglycan teichoic acid transferase
MKKKQQRKNRLKPVLWTIFFIILGVCAASAWYIWKVISEIKPDHSPEIVSIRKDYNINWSGRINVLLLGCDSREDIEMGIRSDTIILANIDLQDKIIRLMSIPRDARVYIPDYDTYDKMNSTINPHYFPKGGIALTLRTVEHLVQMPIKIYAMLDFTAFEKIVDVLGGVRLYVEKDMYYYDPTDGTLINLKEGDQFLDGDKSLQYVRFRWDHQGDFTRDHEGKMHGRVARQMNFMKALAIQLSQNRNLLKINSIINTVARKFETNMDTSEMLKLAITLKDFDPELQLKIIHFPGEGDMINGISYVVVVEDELEELLRSEFSDTITLLADESEDDE